MTGTIVDQIRTGRRLPYSRAFARAGFSVAEAEAWRQAGWHDADEAARWRDLPTDADPMALRRLVDRGYSYEDVARVSRFSRALTVAWTLVLARPEDPWDEDTVYLDLRDQVRQNLLR